MDWLEFGVQWLHVIFAVFWFGSTMYLHFVLLPTMQRIPPASARDIGRAIVPRMAMAMRIAGAAVIALGVVRGIGWGPRNATETGFDFASSYGITWSVSILLALAIFAIGDGVVSRTARRLYGDDGLWSFATAGGPPPAGFVALAGRLRAAGLAQFALFVAAFTGMILMRFGF